MLRNDFVIVFRERKSLIGPYRQTMKQKETIIIGHAFDYPIADRNANERVSLGIGEKAVSTVLAVLECEMIGNACLHLEMHVL